MWEEEEEVLIYTFEFAHTTSCVFLKNSTRCFTLALYLQVGQDQFAIWLLLLLGRVDETDIKVVRDLYSNIKARKSGKVTVADLASVVD